MGTPNPLYIASILQHPKMNGFLSGWVLWFYRDYMPFLVGFSGGWGFPFYSAAAFPHPPTIIAPKTPHFSLARDVPKPRDAGTKTKTYFLVVFHWSHAVPCPKSQGMLTKRLVSTELGILGQLGIFLGGMEIVFHLIVAPCCPMSQKPRDVDKKIPSLVFLWKVFHFIVVPCCPMSQSQRIFSKLGI